MKIAILLMILKLALEYADGAGTYIQHSDGSRPSPILGIFGRPKPLSYAALSYEGPLKIIISVVISLGYQR